MGAEQQQLHATGIAQHHGADLQQLQADRADIGAGQFGAGECDPADGVEQHIGKRR